MSAKAKMTALIVIDVLIIWLAIFSSYYFRFIGEIPEQYVGQIFSYGTISTFVFLPCMILFKQYKQVWRYASVGELISIVLSVTVSCAISWGLSAILLPQAIPLSVIILSYETILLLVGGVRFVWRVFRGHAYKQKREQRRALIVGAGGCGTLVAKLLKLNKCSQMYPVAFVDDDPAKRDRQIMGLQVEGGTGDIPEITAKYQVDDIIIAMPSVSKKMTANIIRICNATGAKLKIIPKLGDLIHGRISIKEIRDVEVEDLLGREPVHTDLQGIADYVEGKTVLVTGAGGSIGSELCRQIAPFRPRQLLLLGHGENSIYSIEMELKKLFPGLTYETLIADVQDRQRLDQLFERFKPQVVFHAAAHKHVPLMERNPAEAIKNNVLGTKNTAECADKYGAERFVLISTDKAVNPSSVMGTTKRIAEMVIQSMNAHSQTKFTAVRFGNVLGSRGSVIPRFKEQIASGGPVTVTDPKMIRYFMTIPEAVQLVIQAGSLAKGGEVFILDMGEPVKIVDLAKQLIRLSGFEANVDIDIEFTGMRPGEKLYEELLTDEEGIGTTKHNRIYIGKPSELKRASLEFEIMKLEKVLKEEPHVIRDVLKHIVPTFTGAPDLLDHAPKETRRVLSHV